MELNKIEIRNEQKKDYRKVEEVTREAFWNRNAPGCNEHFLAHILRDSDAFVKELDFVAALDDEIVGNIMYTKAKIKLDSGDYFEVLSFGPVSVLPEHQGEGIGKKLIKYSVEKAKELGYSAILIYGDPNPYSKFGFKPAKDYKIGTSYNTYAVALQVLELETNSLKDKAGLFFEDSIYHIDEKAAQEFDKTFPQKVKLNGLPTQERFMSMLKMNEERNI